MLVQIAVPTSAHRNYPRFARAFDGKQGRVQPGSKLDFNSEGFTTIDISDPKETPKKPVWITVQHNWLRPAS